MRINYEYLEKALYIGDDIVPDLELNLRKTKDDFEKYSSEDVSMPLFTLYFYSVSWNQTGRYL